MERDRKYHNKPTDVDGLRFDSRAEANRYGELKLLLLGGAITDLTIHPRWPLRVNGVVVGTYVGDFAYSDVASGRFIIEDVKVARTAVYLLKRKLMLALHGLVITEIAA
jgi:hypothetical protein